MGSERMGSRHGRDAGQALSFASLRPIRVLLTLDMLPFRLSFWGKPRTYGPSRRRKVRGLGRSWILLSLWCYASLAGSAQSDEFLVDSDEWQQLIRELYGAIALISDYRPDKPLPRVFQLPQHALEAKICDTPCNVSAAYLPKEGIFLAENLDPFRSPEDRAALLHELVHYLQQGHQKFAALHGCERERAKEEEAYTIHNAYLASIKSASRVVFYAGEFDCAAATK